jgi:hypothetical protein
MFINVAYHSVDSPTNHGNTQSPNGCQGDSIRYSRPQRKEVANAGEL